MAVFDLILINPYLPFKIRFIIDKISTMAAKIICLLLLLALALSRSYPLYKQCDSRWGN